MCFVPCRRSPPFYPTSFLRCVNQRPERRSRMHGSFVTRRFAAARYAATGDGA